TSSFEMRMALCDTVVWIDQPRLLCLLRAVRRVLTHGGRVRPDMAGGCREKVDLAFWRWIWTYDAQGRPRLEAALKSPRAPARPRLEAALKSHAAHARLVRLTSDRAIETFLAEEADHPA